MKELGIKGLECYYSRYNKEEFDFLVDCAKKNNLLISGGSDYHGKNKLVRPGDTNLTPPDEYPEGLTRFLDRVGWDNNTGGNI